MNKTTLYSSRRRFIQQGAALLGGALLAQSFQSRGDDARKPTVSAHLWQYASKYPPDWDATPDLETIFSDLSYAGLGGVELMENVLRHDDAVERLQGLIKKYGLPVTGTSYGVHLNMWNTEEHKKILDDVNVVVPRLAKIGGKTFGISVGESKEKKTEAQLDAQAAVLKKVLAVCNDHGIEANLHNHTYEVENGMHDLHGTLSRIPGIRLGPDLNWLIRGGIDPIRFINTYGKQIVYLHIRDQYADGTWTEYLGQGATDFSAIATALQSQSFSGNAAIELAFPKDFKPANALKDDWKMSREYVQSVFGW